MAIIMVAWLLSNCGKRHDTLSVDSMTGIGMDRHELMDRQLAVGMQQSPDSVLGVIDSLQTGGWPQPPWTGSNSAPSQRPGAGHLPYYLI